MTTEPISVLIVDDEPIACRKLRRMLVSHPECSMIQEVYSGEEAVRAIQQEKPQLVFLDIQMPDQTGFDVLKAIPADARPLIIFVTAYDEFAVQAFEAAAVDYLLKPFSSERFEKALARAENMLRTGKKQPLQDLSSGPVAKPSFERMMIRDGDRIHFLPLQQIHWIEAQGRYVHLHTGKEKYLLRQSISSLESRLPGASFVRINRKQVVNIDRVLEMQVMFHGQYRLVLQNSVSLTISRRYFSQIRDRLGLYAIPAERK